MATGVRTARAGPQQLEVRDSLTANLYVPPQCVGARRCPLVVGLDHNMAGRGPVPLRLADQYGMIVLRDFPVPLFGNQRDSSLQNRLSAAVVDPGVPSLICEATAHDDRAIRDLDTALTRILRTFAIDPERIAIC